MHRLTALAVRLALLSLAILLIPAAHAGDKAGTITISREIPFADSSGASDKVQSECTLQTRLPEFIRDHAKKLNVVLADDVDEITEGRVLHLEIVSVIGFSGGAWSGAKSVSVAGKLIEDGEVIGTFASRRYSGGGAFGGYKGTCSILGRCIKTMGSDIATWLAKPTMDAKLGDA